LLSTRGSNGKRSILRSRKVVVNRQVLDLVILTVILF
jgi:hypothetical protein